MPRSSTAFDILFVLNIARRQLPLLANYPYIPSPPHRRCRHFIWTVAAIAAGHLPLLTSSQLKLTSPILVQAATELPLLSDF